MTRKTLLSVIFLSVFTGVVAFPSSGIAAPGDCTDLEKAGEDCGAVKTSTDRLWCWAEKNTVYRSADDCLADQAGVPPANFKLATDAEAPSTGGALLDRIQLIANWVFAIFLAISLIYIILGAFQFVTAGAEPAKISQAREKIIYAIVGIAIGLLVAGVPLVLRSILT